LVVIAKRQHFLDYRNIWLLYRVLNKSLFHEYEWTTIDEYQWIAVDQIFLCHLRAIQLWLRGLWRGGSMAGNHGHASIVCTQCFTLASIARPGRELRGMPRGAYTHLDSHQWHNYQKSQQRQQGLAGKSVRYAQAQDLWTCGFVAARRSTRSIHSFHFIH
jgi:hypothetical protein